MMRVMWKCVRPRFAKGVDDTPRQARRHRRIGMLTRREVLIAAASGKCGCGPSAVDYGAGFGVTARHAGEI